MQNIFETVFSTTRYVLTGASILAGALFSGPAWADHDGRPVKIMIINMFGGAAPSEASAFTGNLHLTEAIQVRGLSPDYPNILCNSDDVCQMIAGEGHANVAASTMALILSEKFDLQHTYFLIAGIAGIDPHQGTTGSAAWARYLIDYGFPGRSMPARFLERLPIRALPHGPMDIWQFSLRTPRTSRGTRCPVCRHPIIAIVSIE